MEPHIPRRLTGPPAADARPWTVSAPAHLASSAARERNLAYSQAIDAIMANSCRAISEAFGCSRPQATPGFRCVMPEDAYRAGCK